MRYAICNELFEGLDHREYLPLVASLGYEGVELAPFAFPKHLAQLNPAEARALGNEIRAYGLEVVGLHWLLARTSGLHIASPERDVRDKTVEYMVRLIRCCGDMGGKVMVFGSPQQRNILPGVSRQDAWRWAVDFFQRVAPVAAEEGVTICIEPLSREDTNFLTTKDEAVELILAVAHPYVALHLDVRAMTDEGRPLPEIIHEGSLHLRHFHANDGKLGPGMGSIDYQPILAALEQAKYSGWISVEVFDFTPGAERIARESIQYLKRVEQELVSARGGHS